VIVPKKIDGLLIPVPVSGTHIGFSTLRMEPCWMALGQAAGTAAAMAVSEKVEVRNIDIEELQKELLEQGAVLIYFEDAKPEDPHYLPLQYFALRGFFGPSEWQANLNAVVDSGTAACWTAKAGCANPASYQPGRTTRGELLSSLYAQVLAAQGPDKLEQ
jgi:hypothetical protein